MVDNLKNIGKHKIVNKNDLQFTSTQRKITNNIYKYILVFTHTQIQKLFLLSFKMKFCRRF